nr:hypothetical protein [Sphingomonas sp. Y57]
MQRTIEMADFELPRGPVSIAQLMAMPHELWDHLRIEVTKQRQRDPDRPLARCRLCQGPVFIRSQAVTGGHAPVYAHYPESPRDCPWHHGANLIPDDARAAQYRGHQECALHRWMCDMIATFLRADPRSGLVTVDRYRRPAIEKRGRYPDVYAELEGLGRFAIEVQLSKPFAPEIAARHLHYEAEGVALIWVFRELPDRLPQGFRDVITLQRGNAFLFDDTAFTASAAGGRLLLSACLENDRGGWLKPRLVGLDDLDRSSGRATFVEDRRSARLLAYCQAGRAKWWQAFREAPPTRFDDPFAQPCFIRAWDSIKTFVPNLSLWKRQSWSEGLSRGERVFAELAAILFSIAHCAASGEERVYVTRYTGEGALVAMLNAKLSGEKLMPYADLIATMLAASSIRDRLERPSLATAIARAKSAVEQVAAGHPVWDGASRLFPEIFDGLRRAELDDLGKLPRWAGGSFES